ncbi:alpha/beta fold hydrolase [Caenimonas sedimenti]|nr:alpha/beta hydrolase [Caenimonas sedimenti]
MSYQFSPETTFPKQLAPVSRPAPRRTGRFARTRGLRLMRGAYAVLCRLAPAVAAQLAYAQLATPPRTAQLDSRLALRDQALGHRLPFAGGDLAVLSWGQGPAVLLVHGWGSHATHMDRMIGPLVGAGYRVVAFDAPAHGQSTGRATDLVQFAAAIAAVAAHTGPLHAVLAHSFGASMALYAQRDWGLDAKKMVLVSSFDHCNWFTEAFAEHVGLTAAVLARVRDRLVRLYGGRLDWARMSVVDMLRGSDSQALVIHDEEDEEIPFEHGLALANARPGVRFRGTRGFGHQLVLRSAGVIDAVVEFISSEEAS